MYFIIHWYVGLGLCVLCGRDCNNSLTLVRSRARWSRESTWNCSLSSFEYDFASSIRNRLFFIDFSCCFLFHTFFSLHLFLSLPVFLLLALVFPFNSYICSAECWWYILYIYSTMNDHWIFFTAFSSARFFLSLTLDFSEDSWFLHNCTHSAAAAAIGHNRPAVQFPFEIRETNTKNSRKSSMTWFH